MGVLSFRTLTPRIKVAYLGKQPAISTRFLVSIVWQYESCVLLLLTNEKNLLFDTFELIVRIIHKDGVISFANEDIMMIGGFSKNIRCLPAKQDAEKISLFSHLRYHGDKPSLGYDKPPIDHVILSSLHSCRRICLKRYRINTTRNITLNLRE